MPGTGRAGWRRVVRKSTPPPQREAEDVRGSSAGTHGATPIRDVPDRELVCVCGTVRDVNVRPGEEQMPALIAELDDGTGTLRLVWLGRRSITGIEPGRTLSASGRVCFKQGVPVIFNPSYDLRTSVP